MEDVISGFEEKTLLYFELVLAEPANTPKASTGA